MSNAPKTQTASPRRTYKERFKHGARVPLRTVREAMHLTQVQAAERSGIDQSELSRIERGTLEGRSVSVLRRYVEASGAALEIVAVLPNGGRMILVDPEDA